METNGEKNMASKSGAKGAESLLERANRFLKAGKWDKARENYLRALELDPGCTAAYPGLTLAYYESMDREETPGGSDHTQKDRISAVLERMAHQILGDAEAVEKAKAEE